MTREHSNGFSVIEALVAIAILAIALVPILALQAQATRDSTHESQIRSALTDQRNAMAILRTINPMQQPTGRIAISTTRFLSWSAAPLSRITPTVPRAGAETAFDTALYRLTVEIRNSHNARETSFVVDKLGWQAHAAPQQ